MSPKPETLVETWFRRVWNERDAAAIDELFAADGLAHGLGKEPVRGPAAFKVFHRAFLDAFADVKIAALDEVRSGEKTMVRARATAVLKDGRSVTFDGYAAIREKDGKIAEAWNTWDFMTLLEGMGFLPENALSAALVGALLPLRLA